MNKTKTELIDLLKRFEEGDEKSPMVNKEFYKVLLNHGCIYTEAVEDSSKIYYHLTSKGRLLKFG